MTAAELRFLKRLLAAQGDEDSWVEVGPSSETSRRTANEFKELGLIWTENRGVKQTWATLRKGDEIEQ